VIWHDIDQNTEAWKELRCGKITGSALGKIMANEGKAFGDPAKDYALQLALERITGCPYESGYTNPHMERGHEQEPLARMMYEETYFTEVSSGGFFDLGHIGCSPDGLVDGTGLIEIKSVIAKVHYANVKRGGIDPAYKWQVYGNLKYTGREWIDFVSFSAEYPEGKQLYTHRTNRAECGDMFERIEERVTDFERLVKQRIEEIMN
jgi:hypothetical protein